MEPGSPPRLSRPSRVTGVYLSSVPPKRPLPTRVAVFIDGQNLYNRCKEHFGSAWAHPRRLAEELVAEDRAQYGSHSHILSSVRLYTGVHTLNRNPTKHGEMTRRLQAYEASGVATLPIPLRYDKNGRAREKGVDVRLGLDVVRLGYKGLYDVAIIVSEDSDLDEAVRDVYDLRDRERWIAVENALPHGGNATARNPRWLPSAARKRPITPALFAKARDLGVY